MDNLFEQELKKAGGRQKVIGENTYSIKLLPATVGLKLGNQMIKGLAPVIAVLADNSMGNGAVSVKGDALVMEEQTLFTDMAVALVRQLDELDAVLIIKSLLFEASCNGQPIDFDNHFMGRYGELISIVEYALKENFGDFFIEYLKGKGLEIPTLRSLMKVNQGTQEESED